METLTALIDAKNKASKEIRTAKDAKTLVFNIEREKALLLALKAKLMYAQACEKLQAIEKVEQLKSI